MNLKNLYTSAAILAVIAIIVSFLTSRDNTVLADERIGSPIITDKGFLGTTKVTLESNGESVSISLDPASKQWVVDERYKMPANFDNLRRQIQTITGARLQRLVSEKTERFEELGFSTKEGYTFEDASGKPLLALELGRTAENGRQLVKFAGEDKVFLSTAAFSINANPDSWLVKELVEYEDSAVRKIALTLQNGESLEVQRADSASNWTAANLPEGKELNQSAVGQIISRLTGLSFTATADLGDEEVVAAKANGHAITLTLEDGTAYAYQIGRRPEVKVMKEVETEGENGEKSTTMEEEVETPAGKVYYSVNSSKVIDPVNGYMSKTAFEVSSYSFTSLPESLDGLLQDKPVPVQLPEPAE